MLELDSEKVCYLILKAREFEAKEDVVEEDPGSNHTDEGGRGVLADYPDDPVYEELESFLDNLNEDELVQLVALAWVGRGDFSEDDWEEAVETARDRRAGSTTSYLLGMPLLPDFLEEGLARFGKSCKDYEMGRL